MKRFLSILLCALLLVTLAVPARAAEDTTDQRLAQVTAKVKETLGIGDEYDTFHGELWENELSPQWNLEWSREGATLSVTATEEGKVLSCYLYEDESSNRSDAFPPAFPAVGRDEARKAAEAFLEKVLDAPLESAVFSDGDSVRLTSGVYRFSGEIALNGLPSPFSFSLTVRSDDGVITRFRRDSFEEAVLGGVPSAKAGTGQDEAGALLKDTLAMRLEYVLDGESGTASLRYLPEAGDEYYVDAQTGKLVNLTEIYKEIDESGGSNGAGMAAGADTSAAAPEEAAMDSGLSQAELEGVAKLEGVRSKENLDALLREIEELGLDKYTLASAGYSLDRETGEVTATLTYTRSDDTGTWRRFVSCDGKTGALMAVYTSAPRDPERTASVSGERAREIAEAFLAKLWGEEFSASALYDSVSWDEILWDASHVFTYAQQENGYFLASNCLQISVDVTDGTVSGLSRQWTEDVTFDSAGDIVDEAAALDAWFGHYELPLAYGHIPVELRTDLDPRAEALMDMGYSYFYALKLVYALREPEGRHYTGVDARTGEVVYEDYTASNQPLTYDDIGDHWAADYLQTLADYGVGWSGGSCRPREELRQIDFVALLASANGYRFDPETGDADDLYRQAYNLGILTSAQREDEKVLTRGEAVRMLLDCAGYREVARLTGIFTCSYADRDQIPEDMLGYAALAQGLGTITGSFDADRTATRAEAAVMLYKLMSRS